MKIFARSVACLIAVLGTHAVLAGTTMVSGNIYDVGKVYYSSGIGSKNDSVMCWAAASSNVLQYWQDTYGASNAPDGLKTNTYTPAGTNYLNIYNSFLTNWSNGSGSAYNAFSWWLQGGIALEWDPENPGGNSTTTSQAGYRTDIFGSTTPAYDTLSENSCFHSVFVENMNAWPEDHSYYSKVPKQNQLKSALDRAFSGAGQAVVLNVCRTNYAGAHAITCWGYEENADGSFSLLMTDSDDSRYGAFIITATAAYEEGKGSYIKLETKDGSSWYSQGTYMVYDLISIKTPVNVVQQPGSTTADPTAAAGIFKSNTTLSQATTENYGFIIGGGRYDGDTTGVNAASIFTTTAGAKLTAKAAYPTFTGFQVKDGSMALLHGGMEISGFGVHGVEAIGHLYTDGGSIDIQGNSFSNKGTGANGGGGIRAGSYVEIKNAEVVNISGNSSDYTSEGYTYNTNAQITGGGGILSEDSASLLNNTSVKVEDNRATGDLMLGGGIGAKYSKVCGNGTVSISRNTLTSEHYNRAAGGAVGGFENYVDNNGSVEICGNSVTVNYDASFIWVQSGGSWVKTAAVDATALGGALATPMYWNVTYIPGATISEHASHILPQLSLSGNGSTNISGNKAEATNLVRTARALGGGIGMGNMLCACGDTIGTQGDISGNKGTIRFNGNQAVANASGSCLTAEALGGAIYVSVGSSLSTGGAEQDLVFTGNSAVATAQEGNSAELISQGGAIYNAGTLDLSGNRSLCFSGNSAQQGNDIYNAEGAVCNISGNGSTTFAAESPQGRAASVVPVAVENHGDLYVSAAAGHTVLFENTALATEGDGKTYIGKEYGTDSSADASGRVLFTATATGAGTTVAAKDLAAAATVQDIILSAELIAAAGDSGTGELSNTAVTALGPLTMSSVRLDSSDSVTSTGADYITLDNVVVTLTAADMVAENTFDLTGLFRGNFNLGSLTFDLTDSSLSGLTGEGLVFDMGSAYAKPENRTAYVLRQTGSAALPVAQVGMLVLAPDEVPEPAGGTLALLAMTGLATRRRRRS